MVLGVSYDTVRRWAGSGRLQMTTDETGRYTIDGVALAEFAEKLAAEQAVLELPVVGQSARNRFPGLVTRVVRGDVMAQVEVQAGPHRMVSLMSREAADALALEPGVLVVGSVKSTSVVVELPKER